MSPLLSLRGLSVSFGHYPVLDDISLDLARGETLGIVGESGSGKSLTGMSLLGLLPQIGASVSSGTLELAGHRIDLSREFDWSSLRGPVISLVTQNPMTSLDPLWTVGEQIVETAMHRGRMPRQQARQRALELLQLMRVPAPEQVFRQYPFQLSGGLRQRIVIALALAAEPQVIVADEPTTALDVTVQAQVIMLLKTMCREQGIGLVLITHDMGVIATIADRVSVLYSGRVVETAAVDRVFADPQHPYTAALIGCIPTLSTRRGDLHSLAGMVPRVGAYPGGCRFHPRCREAIARCSESAPALQYRANGSAVACHRRGEAVPNLKSPGGSEHAASY